MNTSLVLTVLSDDRPGIVEQISKVIRAHNGVWVESRMASLAGKFAGVLRVRAPDEQVADLRSALTALASEGLQVLVDISGVESHGEACRTLRIELLGPDRPGIVHQLSAALAKRGISVEELTTEVIDASMAGGELFEAVALVKVPESISADELTDEMEVLGNELVVDIRLETVE